MDLFNTSTNTDQVKLEDLVGEGKKYRDVTELAKAKVHADAFIEQLKAEKAQVLEDLKTRTAVEDAIKKLQAPNANGGTGTQTEHTSVQTQSSEQKANFTLEDVDKLLEQKDRQKKVQANLNTVSDAILRYAGTPEKAKEFLTTRAGELGVTVDKLSDVGKESPTALLKLLGLDKAGSSTIAPIEKTTNIVRVSKDKTFDMNAPMTKADYDELRRENPSLYFSPKVQNKLMKDRSAELKQKRQG